jgi:ABC-2 type transport system ATP-binding protein
MLIEIKNVSLFFGTTTALDNLSLEVQGGAVGLLGPNGAGKSTLIKTLLGFVKPNQGSAAVFGMDVGKQPMEIRRQVGYMPEDECLIPGMTAVQLVSYAGELCGMPKRDALQRAHEVLYYVGLDEERYRTVDEYSVGMKQRVKLAQALIHDPKLLLLDEPTNGMDTHGREEMLELVKDIATNKSINVILSSHLLPDVEFACEEIIALSHGSVAEAAVVGYPHEIKGQGIYAYVTLNADSEPSEELRGELVKWVRKEIGPIASPDLIQWAPGLPKTRSGKIMRRILRCIAANEYSDLGDTSTLADPSVVDNLIDNRMNR